MVVRLGECQMLDAFALHSISVELFGVADRDDVHCLLLDFSGVDGMSNLLLGKIVMLRSEMAAKGKMLVLCGLASEIQLLFSMTMRNRFKFEGSVADALTAIGATPWRPPMPSPRTSARMPGLLSG